MSDAGVFQARRRRRIDLAEQWLAMIPQRTEFPGLRPRVEAAILEAQGDVEGALKKLDEVETLLLGIPNEFLREINVRFLRRWKAELVAGGDTEAVFWTDAREVEGTAGVGGGSLSPSHAAGKISQGSASN
jgi:hypothetical protein